ncbi:MAG: ABC transporter substrate-binding protein [Candidatus Promineifilaceae bacterium]
MNARKNIRLIGLLLILALLLAACGTTATEETTVDETTTEETAAEETTEEETVVEETTEPTEITISYLQKLTDLDPLNANNPAAGAIGQGLFDTLLRADDEGNIYGWLAESWEISEDKLTMTFKLREGITFSDGTPLNADAVIFSMDLFQNPELYLGTNIQSMTGWEELDDQTVQVTFSRPDATALYTFTGASASIVSPTAYQELGADGFALNPVGSGPYLLEKWEPGVEVIMVKNPDYWQEGVGLADRIVWRNFADGAAAVLATQSGEVDLLHEQEPKDIPLFEGVEGMKVGTYEGGYYALILNTQMPPFDKVENRQALVHAIDANAIANVAFEGYAKLSAGLLPPASWAYDPSITPPERDPGKVAELLAAAGNPEGFDFKVSVTPQPFRAQVLEIMQTGLSEVGINMEVEVNQFARHIEILQADFEGANAAFVVQQALHPNPETNFYIYLGCNSFLKFSGYCDPENTEFDDLVWGSQTFFDNETRAAMSQQANQIVMNDLPAVSFVFQDNIHVWNEAKLGDYTPAYGGGYNYLWLEPKE